MDSRFKIYSASAGSGKTFNLALEYLTLCFSGHDYTFREILAITFTNKAADEMKTRILNYLYKLSVDDTSAHFMPFRQALMHKTGLSPDQLPQKAKKILFAILHDFSAFSVITIDSFFVNVFRSFSADLLISPSRKPSIDQKLLAELALDDILSTLGINADFTAFFQDYLSKQLSDPNEADVNPVSKLKNLIKKVSKDASYTLLQALKDTSYEEFQTKIENLRIKKAELYNAIFNTNEQIKNIFLQNQISREYCSRGTLYDLFFVKLTDQSINVSQTLTILKNILNKQWHENFNKKALETVFSIDIIERDVIDLSYQIHNNLLKIQFIDNILNLSSLLIILRDAETSISKLSDEENLILLSDISRIINEYICRESGDFIYEKTGNRFKHIFIDEFQDTSRLQWQNMYPLVTNVLSVDGSVKLIGDPKQSIYRFRNADSEQMLRLINNSYTEKYPVVPQTVSLNKNYRSAKTIVGFNNKVFACIRENLIDYPTIYLSLADVIQEVSADKEEGLVEIKKISDKQYDEGTLQYVLSIIQNKINQGYSLSDIAILVRSKKNGILLANKLVNFHLDNGQRIEVTSSESFLLKGNPIVNILINSLRVVDNKDNKSASFDLLYDLIQLELLPSVESQHSLFHRFITFQGDIFSFLIQENIIPEIIEKLNSTVELRKVTVDELIHLLIKVYRFDQQTDTFLAAFVDLVHEYCSTFNKTDIGSFLHYWDTVLDEELSINTASSLNAVQIITIHKAKGLEWPVVILPFFDFKTFMSEEEIIELEPEKYSLKTALVKVRKNDEWPHPYDRLKGEFIEQQLADNLNLMYVAMTRARQEMFISLKSTPNSEEISSLLLQAISQAFSDISFEDTLTIGSTSVVEKQSENKSAPEQVYIQTTEWRKVLKIAPVYSAVNTQKIAEGSKLHALIASCYSLEDFERKLEFISKNEAIYPVFKKLTETIKESPQLRAFYSSEKIMNERKILSGGHFYVPDSMAINDNKISILEYKTGNKNPKHIHQLKNYMQLAMEAGYAIDSAYLIYINNEKVEFEKILLH